MEACCEEMYGKHRSNKTRDICLAAVIFAAILLIYHVNFRSIDQADTIGAPYLSWCLVHGYGFDLAPVRDVFVPAYAVGPYPIVQVEQVRIVSKYPPGSAIMAAPIFAVASLVWHEVPPIKTMLLLGKLAAAIYCALAGALFWWMIRRNMPGAEWPATVLLALGTTMWSTSSQGLWEHGPATFMVVIALLFLTGERIERRWQCAFWAGLALGIAMACRPPIALMGGAVGVVFLFRARWKHAAAILAGAAGPLTLFILYNLSYTGTILSGGYSPEIGRWGTPILIGIVGLTVAPSRGILIYTPAIIIAGYGVFRFVRRHDKTVSIRRDVLWGMLAGSVLMLLVYAKWWAWWGGWCYGPRFLNEAMPVLGIFFAIGYLGLRAGWLRWGANCLVGLCVFIHFLGVFGHSDVWNARHYTNQPYCGDLFQFKDNQICANLKLTTERLERRLTNISGKKSE